MLLKRQVNCNIITNTGVDFLPPPEIPTERITSVAGYAISSIYPLHMPSFADKKAQRDDKRSKTLISENITVDSEGGSQEPSPSAVTVESQCHNPPVVPVVTVPDGLYTDLPSSLSVRKDDVKGKGLWSNLPSRKGIPKSLVTYIPVPNFGTLFKR